MSSIGNLKSNTRQISPAKHWCFTYNNYLSEDINRFVEIFRSTGKGTKYIFQEECGDEGTNHLQGYVCFERKCRPKGLFKEYEGIHWEKTLSIKASIAYCHKRSTRIGVVIANIEYEEDIRVLDRALFHDWQEEIVCLCENRADERTIHWYWESEGNVGKTALSKWLAVEKNALVLSGKAADMKYGIVKFREYHGYYPKIIVFDIPRSSAAFVSWSGIEAIKNGLFFSCKYESDMVVFNCPHVVCFANSLPDMNVMSEDRWCIKKIGDFVTPVASWCLRSYRPL